MKDCEAMLPEDFKPSEKDVIVGWARQNYHHLGNKSLREIVRKNVPRYLAAQNKLDKGSVIVEILERVQSESPSGYGLVRQDRDTGRWSYIGADKAKDKIGHALRKASREYERGLPLAAAISSTRASAFGAGGRGGDGPLLNLTSFAGGPLTTTMPSTSRASDWPLVSVPSLTSTNHSEDGTHATSIPTHVTVPSSPVRSSHISMDCHRQDERRHTAAPLPYYRSACSYNGEESHAASHYPPHPQYQRHQQYPHYQQPYGYNAVRAAQHQHDYSYHRSFYFHHQHHHHHYVAPLHVGSNNEIKADTRMENRSNAVANPNERSLTSLGPPAHPTTAGHQEATQSTYSSSASYHHPYPNHTFSNDIAGFSTPREADASSHEHYVGRQRSYSSLQQLLKNSHHDPIQDLYGLGAESFSTLEPLAPTSSTSAVDFEPMPYARIVSENEPLADPATSEPDINI